MLFGDWSSRTSTGLRWQSRRRGAVVGTIVIVTVCLGIPWVGEAVGQAHSTTASPMAPKPLYHLTLTTPEGKRLIPFDDVLAFSRHNRKGDITVATFRLTSGEV
jgi:hypothetical protein